MYLDSTTAHSGRFDSFQFLLLTERRLGNKDTIFKNMGDTKESNGFIITSETHPACENQQFPKRCEVVKKEKW